MAPFPAHVFDAAAILGVGTPSTDPMPDPEPGFVILRVPDGLSLQTLRGSPVGKQLMHDQDWYNEYPWSGQAPPGGVYRLRLPVPGSKQKAVAEQVAMLPAGETLAPVALVTAALLCIRESGEADPLSGGWTRCAEQSDDGFHGVLSWDDGRLSVSVSWGGNRSGSLWVSSVRAS